MAMIEVVIAVLQGPWWCPMCGYGMGGWGMMFMGLLWLLVIGAVVWLVARYAGGRGRGGGRSGDDAEAILRERYARGEIDDATYRRMLEELRHGR